MVFVTVGSQKFPFDRLIKKVDQMIREGVVQEEVFMQTGTSGYPPNAATRPFARGMNFQHGWGPAASLLPMAAREP